MCYNLLNAINCALKHDSVYLLYKYYVLRNINYLFENRHVLWSFYWRRIHNTPITDDIINILKWDICSAIETALLFWGFSLLFLVKYIPQTDGLLLSVSVYNLKYSKLQNVHFIKIIHDIFQLARQSIAISTASCQITWNEVWWNKCGK